MAQGKRLGKVYNKVEEREKSTKKKQTKERTRIGPQIKWGIITKRMEINGLKSL